MPLKPSEMIRILEKNGFTKVSQKGSHVKMYNKSTKVSIIVPMHSKELKKGLEEAIFKQAGIKRGAR